MRLGKVVKSDSHCNYVVQVDDEMEVVTPPQPEDYSFGRFVKLDTSERHWGVGVIYNSQLFNPMYLSTGPRLTTAPDPLFTPDLLRDTRTLLWVVLLGTQTDPSYGCQGIPRLVVPVNTPVTPLTDAEVKAFHLDENQQPQFGYYSHLLRAGGAFAAPLLEQILTEVSPLFQGSNRRALEIILKEITWKQTMGSIR